jgi:hypothetical protein
VFDNDNTLNFLKLLDSGAADKIYDQYSIQIFVKLIWQMYLPQIIIWEFVPYCIYALCMAFLTSSMEWNYVNKMKILDDETGEVI